MDKDLQKRLISYEPLWGIWNVEQAIESDNAPNTYRISRKNGSVNTTALLEVVNVDCNTFSNGTSDTENVKQALVSICNELTAGTLSGFQNVVSYEGYLIKEVYSDGIVSSYDIIFRMKDYSSLSLEIRHGTKLSQDEVYNLLYDVANALYIGYSVGMVHNNVSLQNILIDDNGIYQLSGFGMNRLLSSNNDAPTSQLHDIRALGLIAYQLLNSNRAYNEESVIKPAPISGVNTRLMSIVLNACENDSVQHYTSIEQFFNDIKVLENVSFTTTDSVSTPPPIVDSKSPTPIIEESDKISPPISDVGNVNVAVETSQSMKDKSSILPLIILCIVVMAILILFGAKVVRTITGAENGDIMEANNNADERETVAQIDEETQNVIEYKTTDASETEQVVVTDTTLLTTTITTVNETPPPTEQITTEPTTEAQAIKTVVVPTTVKKYYVYTADVTWYEAYNDAINKGYQLATFTSEEEWDALLNAAENSGLTYLWIGGRSELDGQDVNLYWVNGDNSYDLNYNSSYVQWYVNSKNQPEPSGFDGDVMEPYLMLWYVPTNGQGWTLCDNSDEVLNYYSGKGKIGYIYMD